jgi:16S rRNA (cytosine1402-N4)-methyltransferase
MHITVLNEEAVAHLNLKKDSMVVDCTLGSAGHAKNILKHLGKQGVYFGIDVDESAIEAATDALKGAEAKVVLSEGNFRNIDTLVREKGFEHVDAILADLGWRMEQFDGETKFPRGFSFKKDEPLAMTYGNPKNYAFTAYDIVNDWAEEDIANVIYGYGEERYSRRIAKSIVQARSEKAIESSLALAEIVSSTVPPLQRKGKIHPATKTFQALRIAVNDEFDALRDLLLSGFELLAPKGRMAIITFHSLEDRIVKETFKALTRDQKGVLVTKKPVGPSKEELQSNPRARSAKLRIIEKL